MFSSFHPSCRRVCLLQRCVAAPARVEHGGALPGFRAEMMRFPNDSFTVILLTNGDDARPDQMAEGIAKIYFANRKQ